MLGQATGLVRLLMQLALGLAALLVIMIVPQTMFAFFMEFGGGRMLLPIGVLAYLGNKKYLTNGASDHDVIAFLFGLMALAFGAYWHPFPRGVGFGLHLSYNRVSAAAIYVVAFFAPAMWKHFRKSDM